MAPKSRAKAAAGAGKGKAGRRSPVRSKSAGVPLLPIVVGGILGVLVIAMIAAIVYFGRPAAAPQSVGVIKCDQLEHTQVHYHAAVQIMYHGNVVNIPDNVGIRLDSTGTNVSCYYWLHVHAANKNIIHIESPASDTFTPNTFRPSPWHPRTRSWCTSTWGTARAPSPTPATRAPSCSSRMR